MNIDKVMILKERLKNRRIKEYNFLIIWQFHAVLRRTNWCPLLSSYIFLSVINAFLLFVLGNTIAIERKGRAVRSKP